MLDTVTGSELTQRVRPRIGISYDAISPLLALGDATIIILSSVAGSVGYQLLFTAAIGDISPAVGLGIIGSLAYGLSARHFELYTLQNLLQPRQDYLRIFVSILFLVLVLTVILFLFKVGAQVSRGSLLCFVALASGLLIASRKLVKRSLRTALLSGMIQGRRAVTVGTSEELASVSEIGLLLEFGVKEVRRIPIPFSETAATATNELAAIASAIEAAREADAQELLLSVPWDSARQIQTLREQLRPTPLPVRLLPDRSVRSIWELQNTNRSVLLVDIQRAPLTRFEQVTKRLVDVLIAGASLLILSPVMLITALVVRLETPGPIIFRQRRKGFNGREFHIYKFRTMRVLEDGPAVSQATRDDRRVTRFGRILRRASIDELPQLFNVLRGEMSIVGPRPHAVAHDDEYGTRIEHYAFRHHVKPGMTGWAQVNGLRGGTPLLKQMEQRIELDLWYINNWTVALDLQIIARTCFELLRTQNAF